MISKKEVERLRVVYTELFKSEKRFVRALQRLSKAPGSREEKELLLRLVRLEGALVEDRMRGLEALERKQKA
jgi:hypothetical protein